MTSKGKQKFSALLANIKKLSVERQKYWLGKIAALKAKAPKPKLKPKTKLAKKPKISKELGVEPSTKDWLLDTANWFDSIYQAAGKNYTSAMNKADDVTLATANELDRIYNDVGREVLRVPVGAGKIVGGTLGGVSKGFLENAGLKDNDLMPYIIGAGAMLGLYMYLKPGKMFPL